MNDPRRYMRMMAFIRTRIEDGTYKPNKLMPSIQKLSDETGFSRHTIGKAMRLLQDEGLALTVHVGGRLSRMACRIAVIGPVLVSGYDKSPAGGPGAGGFHRPPEVSAG